MVRRTIPIGVMKQRGWISSLGAVSICVLLMNHAPFLNAEEEPAPEAGEGSSLVPVALEQDDFSALRTASPFNRVLDIGETYALRGVASLDDIQIATLYNRQTKKSILVTPEEANKDGMKLVGVSSGWDLNGVKATISFAGEEVELKYDQSQISPNPPQRSAPGKSDGRSDGQRKGPSKEDIERYKSLSEENRNKLRQYIGHVMRSYPNMSREEKGNMIRGAVVRLSDGRGIDFPQPQQSGGNQAAPQQARPQPQRR